MPRARAKPPAPEEEISERRCIVTRQSGPPEGLIRFARAPDGTVTPDLRARLPGRGAWVTATRAAVEQAVRKRLFARAFRGDCRVPPDLALQVERLMVESARQALALANKAGIVTTGFSQVESRVEAGEAVVLITAAEAAAEGRRKLRQAVLRRHGKAEAVPVIDVLTADEIGLATGRQNAIHAALAAGAAGEAFVTRCRQLQRYRAAGAMLDGDGGDDGLSPDAKGLTPGPSAESATPACGVLPAGRTRDDKDRPLNE